MNKIKRTCTAEALSKISSFQTGIAFPSAEDRTFWEGLPAEVRKELVLGGERALTAPIPALFLSDYLAFTQTGNRKDFEDKYFARRQLLSDLVLAECAEDAGRFGGRVADIVWAILEESSWCLPAHNTYVRDQPALPLPDTSRPVIDLFAAETAAILSLADLLLGKRLELPELRERLDRELRTRILAPYLSYAFWWMGDGIQSTCNWTPWITQNILLAVFTRGEDFCTNAERQSVLRQAAVSVDHYLSDYGEDGCCNEGAFYYGHSGLCLFGCLDLFNRITQNAMTSLYEVPLIRNIAAYIVQMYAGGGYYINYSDASPHPGVRSARDYLFAKATENDAYASFAAAECRALPVREKLLFDERNLYYRLLQLSCLEDMEKEPVRPVDVRDVFYESVGLMVARDAHWVLAVKAGDNGDSHNHNDIGSITLYHDGRPFLIDLGVETYTAKTFSDRRYEIWTMQSGYHNTLNFAAPVEEPEAGKDSQAPALIMQRPGKEAAADGVKCGISDGLASLTMDLAPAFGDPRIRSAVREVKLSGGTVVLTDVIDSDLPGVLTFMTCEKPALLDGGDRLQGSGADHPADAPGDEEVVIRIGTLGTLCAGGVSAVRIETCPITDARLGETWKDDCYRILLTLRGASGRVTIRGGIDG